MSKKVKMRLLRAGKFKDSAGKEHDFTPEKLKAIADGYSFSGEEDAIPDIISHDNKSPRVGFIRKVYLGDDGNSVFAESELHDDFAQAIAEGFYPSVSVRLNGDETKIQHIAHLGKEKPAIKGLGLPIFDFAENKDEGFDFAEVSLEILEQVTGIWANEIRDALWKIETRQSEIIQAVINALGENSAPQFSQADAGRDEAFRLLEEENKKLHAQLKTHKETEANDFAEGLVKEGKILPRQKNLVVADYLTNRDAAEFAAMKQTYADLPVSPVFTKIAGLEKNKNVSDFSTQELASLAQDYQAKLEKEGKKITISDAVEAVKKGS